MQSKKSKNQALKITLRLLVTGMIFPLLCFGDSLLDGSSIIQIAEQAFSVDDVLSVNVVREQSEKLDEENRISFSGVIEVNVHLDGNMPSTAYPKAVWLRVTPSSARSAIVTPMIRLSYNPYTNNQSTTTGVYAPRNVKLVFVVDGKVRPSEQWKMTYSFPPSRSTRKVVVTYSLAKGLSASIDIERTR